MPDHFETTSTLSPRLIINEVLRGMRSGALDLYTYRLVPTDFDVLLHREDASYLDRIQHNVIAETKKALDDELARLNAASPIQKLFRRFVPYQRAGPTWTVTLSADPDERIRPGSCTVTCTFGRSTKAHIFAGEPTSLEPYEAPKRQAADLSSEQVEPIVAATRSAPPVAPPEKGTREHAIATVNYSVAGSRRHFEMMAAEVRIESSGTGGFADLELPLDIYNHVSLVIRTDSRTGNFCIRNLSSEPIIVSGRTISTAVEVLLDRESLIECHGGGTLEFRAQDRR